MIHTSKAAFCVVYRYSKSTMPIVTNGLRMKTRPVDPTEVNELILLSITSVRGGEREEEMGKLSHDPYIQHFSHPHQLELTIPQSVVSLTQCSCCKLQSFGWMYTCKPCNFTLHISCTQMPQLIRHPAHQAHTLTLLTTPIYPGGLFNCDACGQRGYGFSYHCTHCDFDIHVTCASRPLLLSHHSHPHQLQLTFDPPYQTKGFSCDICRKIGSNHWLYRCGACEFDAHLECATTTTATRPLGLMQPQQPHTHLQHYNSLPGVTYNNPLAANTPAGMNYYAHSQSVGAPQVWDLCQPPGPNGAGNALTAAAVQGFVEGSAQQVGQNFVQGIMSDGSANNGNGGYDLGSGGDSSSSSIINIGSSILSSVFGDSEEQS